MKPKEIVILASGSGTNFQAVINAIDKGILHARIRCLIVDRECEAIARAKKHNISYYLLDRHNDAMLNLSVKAILCHNINLIVCCGYLSVLNTHFVNLFRNRIINIHPSLLPKYGGIGMYGSKIHQAVINAGDKESGCTVHFVNETVDGGEVIAQDFVGVNPFDDAHSLQAKVQKKEHQLLPQAIRYLLEKQIT